MTTVSSDRVEARRPWILAGVLSAVAVFVVRVSMSWGRDEYAIWPDEPAQLAIARFVGGGTRWNMHNHSIWRPMFGTLLAPVHWFTDDPATVLHAAFVLNAVLGGVAAWLLVILARRLTPLTALGCASAALLISLSPSVLFTTDFVFSESLVVPLYLATLWFLLRLHEAPNLSDGVRAGVLAALAFGTHSRMLPLTILVVGVVVVAAVRRRMVALDATVVAVVAVFGAFAMSFYTSYLVDRLWNEPSTRNSIGGVAEQLRNGPTVLVSLAGQTWALLVASLGVVAYGTFALTRSALTRTALTRTALARCGANAPSRGDARVVLIVFGSCAGLSVVFMSDRWRSDQLVYERYNAAVVAPLLIVGLAVLVGAVPMRRLACALAATTLATGILGGVLWGLRRDVLRESNGLEPMILGLQPLMGSATSIDVPWMTLWAVVGMLLVGGVAVLVRDPRRRSIAVVAVVAVAVLVGSARTRSTIDRLWADSGNAEAVGRLRGDVLADGVPVDYYLREGSNSTIPMMLYQFHLPATPVTVVSDPTAGAPSTYVFAPTDNEELESARAQLVWTDPRRPIGLWQR